MDDERNVELSQLSEALIVKWRQRLGLNDWHISHRVQDDIGDDRIAESRHNWRRRESVVVIPDDHARRCADVLGEPMSPGQHLEDSVIHELLHILSQPLHGMLWEKMQRVLGDGIMGAELFELYTEYNEWWIDRLVKVLMDADDGLWDSVEVEAA